MNYETSNFLQNDCFDYSLDELRKHIEEIEIKNLVKVKIPKFNLQLYPFVYDNLIQFPVSDLPFDTVTTNNFFRNVHRLLKVKVDLHLSHVMGKMFGYVHNFCNWQIRENKTKFQFSHINFLAWMLFAFLKDFRQQPGRQKMSALVVGTLHTLTTQILMEGS